MFLEMLLDSEFNSSSPGERAGNERIHFNPCIGRSGANLQRHAFFLYGNFDGLREQRIFKADGAFFEQNLPGCHACAPYEFLRFDGFFGLNLVLQGE